jgi:hypothetical protein
VAQGGLNLGKAAAELLNVRRQVQVHLRFAICDYGRIGANRANRKLYIVNFGDMVKKETACILPGQRAGG